MYIKSFLKILHLVAKILTGRTLRGDRVTGRLKIGLELSTYFYHILPIVGDICKIQIDSERRIICYYMYIKNISKILRLGTKILTGRTLRDERPR